MASFKIAGGRSRVAVAVNMKESDDRKQLITGMEGSKIRPLHEDVADKKQHVIPGMQNTYRVGKGKFTPSFIPPSSDAAVQGSIDDKFEAAAAPAQPLITQYGLEIRKAAPGSDAAKEPAAAAPVSLPGIERDAQQLREDLEVLPEEADLKAYEALPVEEFGKALLRGLGWDESQGIGRKRQLVEAKQGVRRPERLGLGAAPAAPAPTETKRPRKMGDPKEAPADLVVRPGADGRQRHRAGASDVLVPRSETLPGPQPGKTCRLVAGRHEGLDCKVLELLPVEEGRSARARVRLIPSEQVVDVRCSELEDIPPGGATSSSRHKRHHHHHHHRDHEEGREDKKRRENGQQQPQQRGSGRDADDKQQQQPSSKRGRDGGEEREAHGGDEDDGGPGWLMPHIRVKILDKSAGKGSLYLKKAVVLDVHPGRVADVKVEETNQVLTLSERRLETVVPKAAGTGVLLVGGRQRGRRGRLLEMSSSKGVAAVQLIGGTMEVVRVVLDDVAQYMGLLEEEED